jgi:hypothetical protein
VDSDDDNDDDGKDGNNNVALILIRVIFVVAAEAMLLVGNTSNNTIAIDNTSAIARVVVELVLPKSFDGHECEATSCLVFIVLP